MLAEQQTAFTALVKELDDGNHVLPVLADWFVDTNQPKLAEAANIIIKNNYTPIDQRKKQKYAGTVEEYLRGESKELFSWYSDVTTDDRKHCLIPHKYFAKLGKGNKSFGFACDYLTLSEAYLDLIHAIAQVI